MKRGRELEIKIRMEKDEEMMELRGARKMLVCLDERQDKEKMLKRERTCDKDRDKER